MSVSAWVEFDRLPGGFVLVPFMEVTEGVGVEVMEGAAVEL